MKVVSASQGFSAQAAVLLRALILAALCYFPSTDALSALTYKVLDGSYKVRPTSPTPVGARSIAIESARNEAELSQIQLSSPTNVSNVMLTVTALSGPSGTIPATDIELLYVHPVRVDAPSDSLGAAGEWPDALVPLKRAFTVRGGRHQPIMLRVFVRNTVRPGVYNATVNVASGGLVQHRIPLRVQVWDVTLPAKVSLPIVFGLDFESIRRFEGNQADPTFTTATMPKYYNALKRSRAYPISLYNAMPNVTVSGSNVVIDFTSYEALLDARFAQDRSAPVLIPFTENWPIDKNVYPLFSATYNDLVRSYLRQMAAFFERKGMLQRSYLYIPGTDEPATEAQYAYVHSFKELVQSADSRLRVLQTAFMKCLNCNTDKTAEDLEHPSTLWVPNIAYYDNKALRVESGLGGMDFSQAESGWTADLESRVRARGGEVWWYFNPWTAALPGGAHPRYGNMFIDHDGMEHRALGWTAYASKVTALSHWNGTYWAKTTNPWTRVARGEEEPEQLQIAGDGSLLYPALGSSARHGQPDPAGPVTSLRLELLRDASEDYELLKLLADRGQGALADSIAAQVSHSLTDYERNEATYRAARRQVATALQP